VRLRAGSDDGEYLYSISVVCSRQIKHVLVRLRTDQRYAIGTPKPGEKVISSPARLFSECQNKQREATLILTRTHYG